MVGCSFWFNPKDDMLFAMVEEGEDVGVIETDASRSEKNMYQMDRSHWEIMLDLRY